MTKKSSLEEIKLDMTVTNNAHGAYLTSRESKTLENKWVNANISMI